MEIVRGGVFILEVESTSPLRWGISADVIWGKNTYEKGKRKRG
jgi:hypothetical protein